MNGLKYDQLLISRLNNEKQLFADEFNYKAIFFSLIIPDHTNARFLPAKFIEDGDANLFVNRKITKKQLVKDYEAENQVLIGKSCIINCLKYGTIDWKKANQTIESIIDLGKNITETELIQPSTIYPVSESEFQILTGHRRFFALVYAKGYGSSAEFKVYVNKPLLVKIKQFQENASREDLPQYGKLKSFVNANHEIDALNTARLKVGLKRLTIKDKANNLGISMGAYDNYNVLTRYTSVVDAYESGLSFSFVKTKKIVLDVESEYKKEYEKDILNIRDRQNVSKEIELRLNGIKQTLPVVKSFKIKPIKSHRTIKKLLTTNIMELDTGINWDEIDWEDSTSASETMSKVIEFLENM